MPIAKRHRKQDKVGGLRVTEYAAADGIGKRAEKSGDAHQNEKGMPFFTGQIINGFLIRIGNIHANTTRQNVI